MSKAFLIKYGEIGIKGKNRHLFEDALVHQIKYALKPIDGTFQVTKEQGRIYIEALGECDQEEVIGRLQCVFGIVGICPVEIREDQSAVDCGRLPSCSGRPSGCARPVRH